MKLSAVREALASARHLPDRLLHSRRRRAATRLLARAASANSILFVCHGNICRSPFAAGLARALLPGTFRVASAGFIGPGRGSPEAAVAAARAYGVDLDRHQSQVMNREELTSADVIAVMDSRQRRQIAASLPAVAGRVVILGDLDPEPIERRAIRDPVEQPDEVYRASYARIARCVRALVAALGYER